MSKKNKKKNLRYDRMLLIAALLAAVGFGGYKLYGTVANKEKGNITPNPSSEEASVGADEPKKTDEADKNSDTISDNEKSQELPTPELVVDKPTSQTSDAASSEAVVAGKINSGDWRLLLVNKTNPLPENFKVKLTSLANGHAIDERAYPELQQMMDDARAEGFSVLICSSYRSNEKQVSLFEKQITRFKGEGYSDKDAAVQASEWVAIPGTSEHQLGLAVDIVSSDNQILTREQENTPEQQWLMANCYKYGFILRYPEDKCDVTGITYEPWHYRYVGKEIAKYITENGLCLEEYLDMLNK